MKHTGDYELDEINMLEQECQDLEEENKRLEEENKKLKFDIEARKEMKKAREEKVRFLEECLDNKEKVNKSLREKLNKAWLEEYWFFNEY